jgi:hypothetical protein
MNNYWSRGKYVIVHMNVMGDVVGERKTKFL